MIFLHLLTPLGDFIVYWEAAFMMVHRMNPYLGIISSAFPYNYPPPSFLFILPLGFFTFHQAGVVWNFASLTAFLLSLLMMLKISQKRFSIAVFALLSVLFTVFYFPVKFNMGMGQINHFVLFFCVLSMFLYQRGRKNLSAVSLAYAIGIKLAPIIFIFYFVLQKDWKQVLRTFFWTIVVFLLPILFVPWEMQQIYYSKVFFLSWTLGAKDWYYNQSLEGFLARTFKTPAFILGSTYILTFVIGIVNFIKGLNLGWKRQMATVGSLYLLIHPIALQHYFGFAIIPFVLLVEEFRETKVGKFEWVMLIISYFLLANDIKGFENWTTDLNFALSHQFYGILILWVLAMFKKSSKVVTISILTLGPVLAYILTLLCKAKLCL